MRRREFITLIGGTAVAWPLAARAQRATMPVIGFVSGRSPDDSAPVLSAFHEGLAQEGFTAGRTVNVEYRWARGEYSRAPTLVAELIRHHVAVLALVGGLPPAVARKVPPAIPVVFVSGADPVKSGWVKSFNEPGGQVTGSYILGVVDMEPKRLGLMRELLPHVPIFGVIIDSNFRFAAHQIKQLEDAAQKIKQRILIAKAGNDAGLDAAFAALSHAKIGALLIAASPYFDSRRDRIVSFAVKHRLPTAYQFREFAVAGGLMSYGPSFTDAYRTAGVYTGRILKGARPSELPVMQSSKFELVINRKTAKALDLEIPAKLLAIADEILE